jgi:hypothetical protein
MMRRVLSVAPAIVEAGIAVIDAGGGPPPLAAWLTRLAREGVRVPVRYVHDAATVIYPFAVEPLASVAQCASEPIDYRDLGLPPLGATARRFADPRLQPDEPIVELEAVPPTTLARYCARAAALSAPRASHTGP